MTEPMGERGRQGAAPLGWDRQQMVQCGMTDVPAVTRWRLLLLHRPRWLHRFIALFGGYFWLPCPLCGRFSGGHEWRYLNQEVPTGDRTSQGVCPWCAGRPETVARGRLTWAVRGNRIRRPAKARGEQ